MAAPVCEFINANSDRIRVTPSESGGAVMNYRRVTKNEMGFGQVMSGQQLDAWLGNAPFEEKLQDARVVGPGLSPITHVLFVRDDSSVQALADLEGKSVGGGSPGSTAQLFTTYVMKYAGLEDKVDVKFFTYSEMLDMVADRILEGHFRSLTLPSAYLDQCNTTLGGIHLIDLTDVVDKTDLLKDYPYLIRVEVSADMHDWQEKSITAFAVPDWFLAHKDVPADDVYEFARLVYNAQCISKVESASKGLHNFWPANTDPLKGLAIPLHPGAEKFWKAAGVPIPASLLE